MASDAAVSINASIADDKSATELSRFTEKIWIEIFVPAIVYVFGCPSKDNASLLLSSRSSSVDRLSGICSVVLRFPTKEDLKSPPKPLCDKRGRRPFESKMNCHCSRGK